MLISKRLEAELGLGLFPSILFLFSFSEARLPFPPSVEL